MSPGDRVLLMLASALTLLTAAVLLACPVFALQAIWTDGSPELSDNYASTAALLFFTGIVLVLVSAAAWGVFFALWED